MIRLAALALGLMLGASAAASVVEDAAAANARLADAVVALEAATTARDRVVALTQTIRAYEEGLAAMRQALRQAAIRESALAMQFASEGDRLARLLGALSQIGTEPSAALLLHPSGPLGTVRSGLLMADAAPALDAEARKLSLDLAELRDLRILQTTAAATLEQGLSRAQAARAALSQAISNRTELPLRFIDDRESLRQLLESADTLAAFADGLTLLPDAEAADEFPAPAGNLPLPVAGTIIRRAGEPDAAGTRRPGLAIATRPQALVSAPWAATIRYRGPLLNYGNVMILESGGGYLLVLAGLNTIYGVVGEIVPAGAPLGLMGGTEPDSADFLATDAQGGGARETETLYMELRRSAEPVDAGEWFAGAGDENGMRTELR